MRSRKIEIIIFLSLLLVLTGANLVRAQSALSQNQASVAISWSETEYYPGAYGQASITIISNCSQNIEVSMIGIHFDWNTPNTYFENTFNSSIILPSYGSYTFSPVIFYIPPQETLGPQTYYIHFEGSEQGQTPESISWDSQTFTLQLYPQYQAEYTNLLPQVTSKMVEEQQTNYQSSQAKSLLQNGTDQYNQATSLANQSQWQTALEHLQNAQNYFDNASSNEQTYVSQQNLLKGIIVAIPVAVIVSVAIVIVIVIRKRKNMQQSIPNRLTLNEKALRKKIEKNKDFKTKKERLCFFNEGFDLLFRRQTCLSKILCL